MAPTPQQIRNKHLWIGRLATTIAITFAIISVLSIIALNVLAFIASLAAILLALALHNSSKSAYYLTKWVDNLHGQLANAEELKMYEIRDYNRKMVNYLRENGEI